MRCDPIIAVMLSGSVVSHHLPLCVCDAVSHWPFDKKKFAVCLLSLRTVLV